MDIHLPYYRTMHIVILQEVQKEINKMIKEAAPTDSDDDADLSDDTVEGRLHWQHKALFDYNSNTCVLLFYVSLYGTYS